MKVSMNSPDEDPLPEVSRSVFVYFGHSSHHIGCQALSNFVTFTIYPRKGITVDTYLWDACHLPLKTNSIDVFITDLPFGKKSGSMKKNWELYPDVLLEMARVCQRESGRAVILTKDKKAISKTFTQTAQFWRKKFTYWINIGGMQAGVYVLQRTASAT